jgi:hypothetical protein
MASGEYNKKRNGDYRHPVLAVLLGSILGGGGTLGVFLGTPVGQERLRPDPFTGTQGAQLTQRVVHIEEDVASHLSHHPDAENQFDRRIATLEAQYAIILQNQGRILDRLDSL